MRRARENHPDRPVLAYTTEDNEGSRRTAAAGLVRRPDLEFEPDGLWAVVFSEPEKSWPPAAGSV